MSFPAKAPDRLEPVETPRTRSDQRMDGGEIDPSAWTTQNIGCILKGLYGLVKKQ